MPAFQSLCGPTHTNALTRNFNDPPWSRGAPYLIRDEEVVGSNPATPTRSEALSRILTGPLHVQLRVYAAAPGSFGPR
jgi:hypothetical protein